MFVQKEEYQWTAGEPQGGIIVGGDGDRQVGYEMNRLAEKSVERCRTSCIDHGTLSIEYHFKYTSGPDEEISEQRIKEIDNKKQEIKHKYGKDLMTFAMENCQKGAETALKLVEIFQKLKLI